MSASVEIQINTPCTVMPARKGNTYWIVGRRKRSRKPITTISVTKLKARREREGKCAGNLRFE